MLFISFLLLLGCGFKPRGGGYETLTGQAIILYSDNPFGQLERSIKTTLGAYSVKLETSSKLFSAAPSSEQLSKENLSKAIVNNGIQITHINFKKNILSVDVNGRPAEYETLITVDVSFIFKSSVQQQQIQVQQFSVERDYRYDNNNTLAADRELENLILEMYDQLANRIVAQFSRQMIGN